MEQEIKISAQPQTDPQICDFVLQTPIEQFGAFRFDSKDEAKGSPLPEELFNVENISSVLIIGSTISVTKSSDIPWQNIGKDIGQAIRKAIGSGNTLIAEERKKRSDDEKKLVKTIKEIIESRINPAIASHGGYIELLDVKNRDLFIRMGGGCQGCAASTATLKQGVEQMLKEEIPDLGQIIDTTDHAAGENPYYS